MGVTVRRILLVLLVAGLVGFLAAGWYYADQLLPAPIAGPPDLDAAAIEDVRDDVVVLPDGGDAAVEGVYGLRHPHGFARLGDVVERGDGTVARRFEVVEGDAPEPGAGFDVTAYAFPDDPSQALDTDVQEVDVTCPLGTCPAWFVPGDDDTWAIFVHGRGGARAEALRTLAVVSELGLPGLVISYRNDGVGPATEDGVGHFGAEEWHDLDAAAAFALDQGAGDLLLVGYSQGGSIVTNWLLRSDRPETAVGTILDAPLLSLHETLELQARQRGIPDPLISPLLLSTKAISTLRAGVSFDEVEPIEHAGDLEVPILLFHGTDDHDVPVETSDRLAAERPDLVTYRRLDGVGHVRAWNADPEAYEDAVEDFVREHALP